MADKAEAWGDGPNRGTAKATPNRQRQCWAIDTLVAEVLALFPETPVEYSNHNAFNAALGVTFDLTGMDGGDSVVFNNLLDILGTDERVAEVWKADYDQTYVGMRPVAALYDRRDVFGLADAYTILVDGEDGEADDEGWTQHGALVVDAGFQTPGEQTYDFLGSM